LFGKSHGKKLLGRPWCKRVDNIEMVLKETGCEVADWNKESSIIFWDVTSC
jgi:hypothetical protein